MLKPREPTVLVFRDGHQQEVTNYAIMGQTVYVLDERTQKIPLANLDVPATVKANDDRGMEFKVPAVQRPAQKKNSDLQPKSTPNENAPLHRQCGFRTALTNVLISADYSPSELRCLHAAIR